MSTVGYPILGKRFADESIKIIKVHKSGEK